MRSTSALPLIFLLTACGGEIVFFDRFEPLADTLDNAPESLHTYASDARLSMRIRSSGTAPDVSLLEVRTEGALSVNPDEEIDRDTSGYLGMSLLTEGAGDGA